MADKCNISIRDYWLSEGQYTVYFPDSSDPALLSALRDLIAITVEALPYMTEQVSLVGSVLPPSASSAQWGHTYDAAKLTFLASGVYQSFFILAPMSDWFLGDGSVDEDWEPAANIIAYILSYCCTSDDEPFTSFSGGARVQLIPGFLAVNGSAATAQSGSFVADFWPQHGGDVKVG